MKIMILAALAFVTLVADLIVLCNSAHAGTWTCSAKNMITGAYDGGERAYIHLSPYGRGNNYPVTKRGKKTVIGRTSNGTPFTCKTN